MCARLMTAGRAKTSDKIASTLPKIPYQKKSVAGLSAGNASQIS